MYRGTIGARSGPLTSARAASVTTIGISVVCLCAAAAAPAGPTIRSAVVRSVPLVNGTHTYTLRVPHTTGRQPPAILYSPHPVTANCRVSDYGYHSINKQGVLRLRLHCSGAPRGARASLRFAKPITRSVPLANRTGTIDVRLDKPPGPSAPLLLLATSPRQPGKCQARRSKLTIAKYVFHLHVVAQCSDLAQGTRGILTVGGLLLADEAVPGRLMSAFTGAGPERALSPKLAASSLACNKVGPSSLYRSDCEVTLTGFWDGYKLREVKACDPDGWRGSVHRGPYPVNVGVTWGDGVLIDVTDWGLEAKVIPFSFFCSHGRRG